MAAQLSNTIVGYDERNQMSFCAAPDFSMQYLTAHPTRDMMIMVKAEDRVCIKLTGLDQGKFIPQAIASYPGFARSYPALCHG